MKWTFLSFLLSLALMALTACSPKPPTDLESIADFGANPGNLEAYLFTPRGLGKNAPLVVVLHGCGQKPGEIAQQSGWNELANTYGFAVLYPQQRIGNNISNCFNWFLKEDAAGNTGEAESIRLMVEYVVQEYKLDPEKVFVTGFSAGGAMTVNVLAAFPQTFAAGASIAGLPFGSASDLASGLGAMQGKNDFKPKEWATLVRLVNPDYTGRYPRLAILHGTDDPVVFPLNAQELTEQWTYLLGYDSPEGMGATETSFEGNANVTRTTWTDEAGLPLVVRYDVSKLGHALPIDPGTPPMQGGEEAQFAKDIDFYSSYWIARFFGLTGE